MPTLDQLKNTAAGMCKTGSEAEYKATFKGLIRRLPRTEMLDLCNALTHGEEGAKLLFGYPSWEYEALCMRLASA